MRCFALSGLLVLLVLTASGASKLELRFVRGENQEFTFDTGVLRGRLRAGGKSAGLSSVVHIPTGMRMDASMGLLSYYRLFTANHRYGTAAWDWPSEASLNKKGDVEVRWAAVAERPFELQGVFHWVKPDVLELKTSVTARTNLPRFEVFLASYFSSAFTNAEILVKEQSGNQLHPQFRAAERSLGYWQAFPRDKEAVTNIQDGRWKYEPNPVDWTIETPFAEPVAFRRCQANGLTAMLSTPRKQCFAVLSPFETEPHYSTYLSLFGRDLKKGQSAEATTRLWIGVNLSEQAMLQCARK